MSKPAIAIVRRPLPVASQPAGCLVSAPDHPGDDVLGSLVAIYDRIESAKRSVGGRLEVEETAAVWGLLAAGIFSWDPPHELTASSGTKRTVSGLSSDASIGIPGEEGAVRLLQRPGRGTPAVSWPRAPAGRRMFLKSCARSGQPRDRLEAFCTMGIEHALGGAESLPYRG